MEVLKKILSAILLLLWAGGIVCSLILAIVNKAFVPILGVVVLAAFGIPTAKRVFNYLKG